MPLEQQIVLEILTFMCFIDQPHGYHNVLEVLISRKNHTYFKDKYQKLLEKKGFGLSPGAQIRKIKIFFFDSFG